MNHKILYAALMIIVENNQQFNIESLAKYLGCSSCEIALGIDKLKDIGAISWSLDFNNNLSIELLADLEIV